VKTSTRRSLGAVMLVISGLTAPLLYVYGVPLISFQESHADFFPGGAVTFSCYKMHWSLLPVCIAAVFGLIALVWPQRKPPRLQP